MVSPSSEEFTIGKRFRAVAAAWTKKGVTVSLTPERSNSACCFSFALRMREQSTSNNVVTWADVRRLMTMCSAIAFRMAVRGTRSTSPVNVIGAASGAARTYGTCQEHFDTTYHSLGGVHT